MGATSECLTPPESSIIIGESIGADAYHDMSYESILALLTEKVRSNASYE